MIDIVNLSLSYNDWKTQVLHNLNFSICEWEVVSIIGKNGTWKSSLLKSIAWIEKNYSGSIIKHTKNIAYVPQKIQLDTTFPLRVEEFFHIFHDTISEKTIQKTLKLFHIEKLQKQNIHSLSGWEFQKVLIVNAMMFEPELMLLDEPTNGIDVIGEEQFYKNIADIKKLFPKLSIILVSHNLHLVYKNSDRVICLHDNKFCCHGTPQELQANDDVKKIFGEHVLPYIHEPHSHHEHTH